MCLIFSQARCPDARAILFYPLSLDIFAVLHYINRKAAESLRRGGLLLYHLGKKKNAPTLGVVNFLARDQRVVFSCCIGWCCFYENAPVSIREEVVCSIGRMKNSKDTFGHFPIRMPGLRANGNNTVQLLMQKKDKSKNEMSEPRFELGTFSV